MTESRLRDHVMGVDSRHFVGRAEALAIAERLLAGDGDARILFVHGAGGIGKSALLREIARRAAAAGRTVLTFDARASPSAIDLIVAALTPPPGATAPVIVVDEVESLGANLVALRDLLLDVLPDDARLVVAGRIKPDRLWVSDGLDAVTIEVGLGPLSEAEGRALLSQRGLVDTQRQRSILEWAAGSPLALTIAATTGTWATGSPVGSDAGDRLIQYLAGEEISGIDPAILEVAAVTWAVDGRLIAAALPDRGTRRAMSEVLSLSVVEQVGQRAVLHPLVALAIRERLRRERPLHHRLLVRRIANHLRSRAMHGEMSALFELANLIEDPAVRTGAGLGVSQTHYADTFRAGDAERLSDAFGVDGQALWAEVRHWLDAAPEFTSTVRRVDGTLVGLAVAVPATAMPDDESAGPLAGPILSYLREQGHDPARTLIGVAILRLESDSPGALAESVRVGNSAVLGRAGLPNPRYLYINDWQMDATPSTSDPVDFMESMGYRLVESLRRVVAGRTVDTWLADFGPGGMLAFTHSLVLAENGGPTLLDDADDPAALLASLREFGDDEAMSARGPVGLDPAEAADIARHRVREAVDAAFDDSPDDRKLRRVLELTYLDSELGEQAIIARLHLSRATYYRRLRAARERFASHGVTGGDVETV